MPRPAAQAGVAVEVAIPNNLWMSANDERRRFWSKVDVRSADECWLWMAAMRGKYGLFNVPPTTIGAHRYAYQAAKGAIPDGYVIDHICRHPRCVNPAHLQAVSPGLNNQNHSGPTRGSKSGVRGVWWCKTWNRWTGQVSVNGVRRSIGHHDSIEAAAEAIRELRNSMHVNNLIDQERGA